MATHGCILTVLMIVSILLAFIASCNIETIPNITDSFITNKQAVLLFRGVKLKMEENGKIL